MPSQDKDRPSGRLGRLLAALRPSRAGPLPVQTGFPTSLADLVVKNHGRLKKPPSPSSKRRNGGVSASPSPSTSPSPPPSCPLPPPPASAVLPSDLPRPDLLPSDLPRPDLLPSPAVRRDKSGSFDFGLGFLAVSSVVSLALLVIWSKKVVAAVTVASFSLFVLESLRRPSLPRRPLPAATERQLYLDGRGRVSPIREVEVETEPSRASCSNSDMGIEASFSATEEKSGDLDEPSNSKTKTKKRSWKKLIANAKKLHRGRKSNGESEDYSGSFRSEGDRADATVRSNVKATGSRRGMANATDAVADEPDSLGSGCYRSGEIHVSPMEVDAPADLANEEDDEQGSKKSGTRFPAPVLVAVVLVGLVAGKLPAVMFTTLCATFFSSVPGFRCRDDGTRRRRLEPLPVSCS